MLICAHKQLYTYTVYAHVCLVCSQGGPCAGKCRAGKPGSGSIGPDHQHAAINCSAERQRGGQDEVDADQQEHGMGTMTLTSSRKRIYCAPLIPNRFQ